MEVRAGAAELREPEAPQEAAGVSPEAGENSRYPEIEDLHRVFRSNDVHNPARKVLVKRLEEVGIRLLSSPTGQTRLEPMQRRLNRP